jgi:hypothetical protein
MDSGYIQRVLSLCLRTTLAKNALYVKQNTRTEEYIEGYTCVIKTGRKIKADIDATLGIARKLGHRIEMARKIESCLVTHNGVKPLIPRQGADT